MRSPRDSVSRSTSRIVSTACVTFWHSTPAAFATALMMSSLITLGRVYEWMAGLEVARGLRPMQRTSMRRPVVVKRGLRSPVGVPGFELVAELPFALV